MNAEPDRGLEQALGEAGERWRASRPGPPDPDLTRLTAPSSSGVRGWGARSRLWAPLAAVAGIAVVLAVVAIPLALQRGSPAPDPAAGDASSPGSPTATPDVNLPPDRGGGVPVEGIGGLLREPDGTTKLCADIAVLASLPPAGAGCGPVFVLATGVDEKWFTQSATTGQRWSVNVRVEGSYRGGTLAVNRVDAFTPDPPSNLEPPIPCPPPAAGWRLGYGIPDEELDSLNRLIEAVRSQPDRFNDVWEGHPDGPPTAEASYSPTRKVYVVGTTGDVAPARAELAAIYRGNLCVHQVGYTAADLEQVAGKLRSVSSTPIGASVDVIANRVRVKVVALDPPTVAILDGIGREALIVSEPLLQWLD